jgi:hypothetical protein
VDKVAIARSSASASSPSVADSLIPYLAIFSGWWALAMFTLSVRIPSQAWQPVLHLFWGQALLVEKIVPMKLLWLSRALWLAVLLLLGFGCWYLLERWRPRESRHRWLRALVSSTVVQTLWLLFAILFAAE